MVDVKPYLSPIPTAQMMDYRIRPAAMRRLHLFEQADTGKMIGCDQRYCRECWREANWKEGQTHAAD